jgi:hypothetical protein
MSPALAELIGYWIMIRFMGEGQGVLLHQLRAKGFKGSTAALSPTRAHRSTPGLHR